MNPPDRLRWIESLSPVQRHSGIQGMGPAEKQRLRQRRERFAKLNPAEQERLRQLHRRLADPKAEFEDDLAELHNVTSKRAADRKDAVAKALLAGERYRVAMAIQAHSWRLLAGAAAGRVDLEALTELQAAWRNEHLAELLKDDGGALLCLRSLWAITESSRALPRHKGLAALASAAKGLCKEKATETVATFEKSPNDFAVLLKVVYAGLALRDDAELPAKARQTVQGVKKTEEPFFQLKRVALALMGSAEAIDREALGAVLAKGLPGEDLTVLGAMACRRAGGQTWEEFRAEARSILGDQALPGSVVVLVNRMSEARRPLVVAAK